MRSVRVPIFVDIVRCPGKSCDKPYIFAQVRTVTNLSYLILLNVMNNTEDHSTDINSDIVCDNEVLVFVSRDVACEFSFP